MEFKNIVYTVDREKRIAKLVINRPDARNALNIATRVEIRQVAESLKDDESIRVLIITGAGDKAFVAGADIQEFKGVDSVTMEERQKTITQPFWHAVENLPIPVIAMINGYCLGGGNELALCCDIRIAADTAKFGQPEINLGIIPGGGATQRLPRLIGWGRAKELILTGRVIDAFEAERIGLVDRVVPAKQLEETVIQIAEAITSKSPLTIKIAKKTINKGIYTDLAAGLNFEAANFAFCFSTKDCQEGVNAYLEKRKPEFRGK